MQLTARQLNRATLDRQLLLHRAPLGPAEAVHRVMALQAQSPVSPYGFGGTAADGERMYRQRETSAAA